MKKLFILFVVMAFAGACNQGKPSESKVNQTANKAETPVATPSPAGNSNTTTTAPVGNGEKVEKPIELSFEPSGFPPDWRWLDSEKASNPSKYDLKSGALKIDLPSGKDLYGETRTAPMLLKAVTGDFEIETKVKFDPKESYQGAGLLIFRNDSNYLRLERGFGGVGGGESGIRFDTRDDEAYEPLATPEKFPTTATTVELKFTRTGKDFSGYWREAGGEWKLVGKYTGSYPETVQIGIIACNTASPTSVEFGYIKLFPVK